MFRSTMNLNMTWGILLFPNERKLSIAKATLNFLPTATEIQTFYYLCFLHAFFFSFFFLMKVLQLLSVNIKYVLCTRWKKNKNIRSSACKPNSNLCLSLTTGIECNFLIFCARVVTIFRLSSTLPYPPPFMHQTTYA